MFHQVTGCKKNIVDDACIRRCDKSSYITNLKSTSYFIKKTRGSYHGVYNQVNFLNTEITKDIPNLFDGYMVDLRDIKTDTRIEGGKVEIVKLFERHLGDCSDAAQALHESVKPSTNTQYKKGI